MCIYTSPHPIGYIYRKLSLLNNNTRHINIYIMCACASSRVCVR